MSSYLSEKSSAFQKGLQKSSNLPGVKRALANQRTSSPTPSNTSISAADRKRPDATTNIVYSQPADTGSGFDVRTQVHYAVEYLKSKEDGWLTLGDIILHLSLQREPQPQQIQFKKYLLANPRVEHNLRVNSEEGGSYRFRPIHNVRNGEQLLSVLQSQTTAQGMNARELRDGWKDSEATIDRLERVGRLLVTRNKKDNHAKMVWADDPTLRQHVDDEFQHMWHAVRMPDQETVLRELEKAKITPTSKSNMVVKKVKAPEKKTKKPRRGGKVTNTHMAGVLRDYSNFKPGKK